MRATHVPRPGSVLLLGLVLAACGGREPIPAPGPADTAARAAMRAAEDAHPGRPVLIGMTGETQAVPLATILPVGGGWEHAFIRRSGADWRVEHRRGSLAPEMLGREGTEGPGSAGGEAHRALTAWMKTLQDPRGTGVRGWVRVAALVDDRAWLCFTPADPAAADPVQALLLRGPGGWAPYSVGTFVDPLPSTEGSCWSQAGS